MKTVPIPFFAAAYSLISIMAVMKECLWVSHGIVPFVRGLSIGEGRRAQGARRIMFVAGLIPTGLRTPHRMALCVIRALRIEDRLRCNSSQLYGPLIKCFLAKLRWLNVKSVKKETFLHYFRLDVRL